MALAAGEVRESGGVHDAQGRPSYTSGSGAPPAGSYWSGGFLRDPDGRKLIAVETLGAAPSAGSYFSGGRLRDSYGRMVVAQASGALSAGQYISGGEVLDAQGRLVLTAESLGAVVAAGDYSSSGLRDQYGRRVGITFSPAGLAGLVGWWKADAISGQSDGAALGTWPDSSGNGRDFAQTIAASKPTYKTGVVNGLPSVLFDGDSANPDHMITTSLAAQFPSEAALFIVFTPLTDSDYTVYAVGSDTADEWWSFTGGGFIGTFRSTRISGMPATSPSSGNHQWSIISSASTWQMWKDGAAQTAQAAGFHSGTSHLVGAGRTGDGSAVFGNKAFHGYVSEIVVCNTVPAAADRQALESYLKSKWGTA